MGDEVCRQHLFSVVGKGWTDACFLQPGDLLCSRDGSTVAVEECCDTNEYKTVYNCRVEGWHTYYVGDEGWDVWSHNQYNFPTSKDARDYWNSFQAWAKQQKLTKAERIFVWKLIKEEMKHGSSRNTNWTFAVE